MARIESKPAHDQAGGGHDPHLAHHFDTPKQQFESGKLGMWIFLATEILLFGGLFCAYAVYRANHPEIFVYAHQFLDKRLGGLNTLILICQQLHDGLGRPGRAARPAQEARDAALAITLLFACGFLGVKGVEYEQKWKHGLLWGKHYHPTHVHLAADGSADAGHPRARGIAGEERASAGGGGAARARRRRPKRVRRPRRRCRRRRTSRPSSASTSS